MKKHVEICRRRTAAAKGPVQSTRALVNPALRNGFARPDNELLADIDAHDFPT